MITHKNLILIILLIFLSNCGYSPIYNNNSESNINIIILEMNGNREINNKINSGLKKYYSKETNNIFRIKMNTILNKEIRRNMVLMGCKSVKDLDASKLIYRN